jgi:hypothetical protein
MASGNRFMTLEIEMYPRINYEMTPDDLTKIMDACKPVPYMVIGGVAPSSPQENANRAWAELGGRMGFDHMTVQPIYGKGTRFFSAVPTENETQRMGREMREMDERKAARIAELRTAIEKAVKELKRLEESPCANN